MRKIAMFDKIMATLKWVSVYFVLLCLYFLFFSLKIGGRDISLAIIFFLLCVIFSLTYLVCYYWMSIEDKTDCDLCEEKVLLNKQLQEITFETQDLNKTHEILLNKQNELNEREDYIAEQENAIRMILDSRKNINISMKRINAIKHDYLQKIESVKEEEKKYAGYRKRILELEQENNILKSQNETLRKNKNEYLKTIISIGRQNLEQFEELSDLHSRIDDKNNSKE